MIRQSDNVARIQKLEAERDSLKAHLSAIRIALGVVEAADDDESAEKAVANLAFIIENDCAPGHMDKLKAQWQDEVLEQLAQHMDTAAYSDEAAGVRAWAKHRKTAGVIA